MNNVLRLSPFVINTIGFKCYNEIYDIIKESVECDFLLFVVNKSNSKTVLS